MKIIKLLALLMSVLMVFSLAACGGNSEADKFVGKWELELDLSDFVNKGMADSLSTMGEYADAFKIDDYVLYIGIEFNGDGTYALSLDKDKSKGFIEDYIDRITVVYKEIFEVTAVSQSNFDTLDELLAASGRTKVEWDEKVAEEVEKIVKQFKEEQEDEIDDIAKMCDVKGKYLVEEGKIYLTDSKNDEIDKDDYANYTISGSSLTISKPTDDFVLSEIAEDFLGDDDYDTFPWEFEK